MQNNRLEKQEKKNRQIAPIMSHCLIDIILMSLQKKIILRKTYYHHNFNTHRKKSQIARVLRESTTDWIALSIIFIMIQINYVNTQVTASTMNTKRGSRLLLHQYEYSTRVIHLTNIQTLKQLTIRLSNKRLGKLDRIKKRR